MDSPIGNSLRKKKRQSQNKRDSVYVHQEDEQQYDTTDVDVVNKENLFTATFLRRAVNNRIGVTNN
jgi:hypothetical protein